MRSKFCLVSVFLVLFIFSPVFAEDINVFAEKTLNDFKNNKYRALYTKMSEAAKEAMPYNGMVDFFQEEKKILGKLLRYEKLDSLQRTIGHMPATIIRYAAHFGKTGAVIVLIIVKENGKLACQNLHVDSLIFAKPEVQKHLEKFKPRTR